ncbi:acyltransferase [Bradyrhizobium sp. 1]|nr:acyltransferase [Bradyrhizobium sp. 1]
MRAIAATMIVLLHAQELVLNYATTNSLAFTPLRHLPWGAGVDLFFVISGFVIVFASSKLFGAPGSRWEFMRRRLIRIVPLYWTALTLRVLVLSAGALVGVKAFPDATAIIASYLFIPYDAMGFGPKYPFPILDLGWTLNYEMFFYVLFALFVVLRREQAVFAVASVLLGGILIATAFPLENIALHFWFQPITLEFALGAIIALLFLRGAVLPSVVRLAMVVAALSLWLVPVSWFADLSGPGFYTWPRVAIWGAGAVLIIAAAVLGPLEFKSRWSRALAGLGDSSYALYLLHPFVFILIKVALGRITVPQILCWPLVLLCAGLAITAAALFHRYAELPVIDFLRKVTAPRIRPAPVESTR